MGPRGSQDLRSPSLIMAPGNGTIMLQKLFNPEWQITSKSFLLSSFLIGFSFSPTAEISSLEFEFEESLPRKTASKRGLDRSQMEQPIKKNKFSYFATDLTFGFVHKRSGNEITGTDSSLRSQNAEGIVFKRNGTSCIQRR